MDISNVATQVSIILASAGGGAVVFGYLYKFGMAIVNYVIRKKPIKLNDGDKKDIANLVAETVSGDMKSGVTVDIDAQIDRATQKRLNIVENKTDEFIGISSKLTNIVKKMGEVVACLKTPDSDKKEALLAAINDCVEISTDTINADTKGTVTIVKKEKSVKNSY